MNIGAKKHQYLKVNVVFTATCGLLWYVFMILLIFSSNEHAYTKHQYDKYFHISKSMSVSSSKASTLRHLQHQKWFSGNVESRQSIYSRKYSMMAFIRGNTIFNFENQETCCLVMKDFQLVPNFL